MPVERFRMTAAGLQQLQVGWEEDKFIWRERSADAALQRRIGALCLPEHYTSEINLHAEAWVGSVADRLTEGVVLLVDYGFPRAEFYHPQRAGGTLMCHYRHRAHADPLMLVGLQDITAHVDFTAIAEAGCAAGLELLGYTSQAAFLLDCDLEKILSASDPNDVRAHLALTRQIKKVDTAAGNGRARQGHGAGTRPGHAACRISATGPARATVNTGAETRVSRPSRWLWYTCRFVFSRRPSVACLSAPGCLRALSPLFSSRFWVTSPAGLSPAARRPLGRHTRGQHAEDVRG